MNTPSLTLIAAVAANGGIGSNNDLLWHDKQDQAFFRASTLGHTVIMGRKTWDSLPERFRPLPQRRNIVITRQADWEAPGAEVAHSLDEALALAGGEPQVFVMGGAEIYALALPRAQTLLLTELSFALPATAFFPAWSAQEFKASWEQAGTDAQGRAFRFVRYDRTVPAA